MQKDKKKFEFEAVPWLFKGRSGAWAFVTLPEQMSCEIKKYVGGNDENFGALKVNVRCGEACWKTSIFPDVFLDEHESRYELPLKMSTLKKANIAQGEVAKFTLDLAA
ncbi:DUF1905 domain-containing protein [Hirschia litorea]|uniref:DUF1905 domain-containing protein n=1 Tax=Hirschia litorea TaxID=1199156 RepID=A0ABW2IK74_9PROT